MRALQKALISKFKFLTSVLVVVSLVTSCSSKEDSFCNSANRLQNSIEQVDLSDLTAALSPDFWSDLENTVTDLENETNGNLNESVRGIHAELNSLIDKLKDSDYDLGKILLSPATLDELTGVTASIVDFVAAQLQVEINANCAK
mgnify:FL=1